MVALVHSLVPPGPKRVDFLISWWRQQAGSRGSVCSLVNKLSENATCPSTGPATGHHQQQGDFPPKSVLGHVTWAAHCRVWSTSNNHEPRSHGQQPGSDFNHGPLHELARRSPSTSARIRSLIYLHRSIRWSAKHHWRSGCQPLRCRFNFRHFGLRCNPRTASAGASYLPQLSYVHL